MSAVQSWALRSAGAFVLYRLLKLVYSRLSSPLRHLKGPGHALNLDFSGLYAKDAVQQQERWLDSYGQTLVFTGLTGVKVVLTTDAKAASHVILNDSLYPKSEGSLRIIRQVLGDSFLVAEGDDHKRQRRFMNPAFGAPQIREVTHVFVDASIRLRDIFAEKLQDENGPTRIDIFSWMATATLDGIGLAGFGYEFNGLKNHKAPPNELATAQRTLFTIGLQLKALQVAKSMFPFLKFLRTSDDQKLEEAHAIISRVGKELLASAKKATAEKEKAKVDLLTNFSRTVVNGVVMSDEEVLRRELLTLLWDFSLDTHGHIKIPTILFAGHDTTSTSATWTFYFLATHPQVQSTLRAHLLRLQTDNPTMDELNGIQYLDSVVRESLRLRAATPFLTRNPSQDDCIPLSNPILDKNGNMVDKICLEKGTLVLIPVHAVNRSKDLWGEDAREFKPERWDDLRESAKQIPSLWGNVMTFGAGPHACIGYRFALIEIKALVFTLIRSFEFELAVPVDQVSAGFLQKPMLVDDPETYQLPLLVKRIETE